MIREFNLAVHTFVECGLIGGGWNCSHVVNANILIMVYLLFMLLCERHIKRPMRTNNMIEESFPMLFHVCQHLGMSQIFLYILRLHFAKL